MLTSSVKIDWTTLTYTEHRMMPDYKVESIAEAVHPAVDLLLNIGFQEPVLEQRAGIRFYPFAFKVDGDEAAVYVGNDLKRQGIMVHLHGGFKGKLLMRHEVILRAMDYGCRVSRIDVAVDMINSGIPPVWIKNLREHYQVKSPRSTTFIDKGRGQTYYIGARESDVMLRIYEKGKEQGIDLDWVRYEVEYKGDVARGIASELAMKAEKAIPDIRRMIGLPSFAVDVLLEMTQTEEIERFRLTRSDQSDRVKWLMSTVIESVRKLADYDYDAAHKFYEAVGVVLANPELFE